jgi:hypothetical protein
LEYQRDSTRANVLSWLPIVLFCLPIVLALVLVIVIDLHFSITSTSRGRITRKGDDNRDAGQIFAPWIDSTS